MLGSAPTVVNDALKGATVYGFSGVSPATSQPEPRARGAVAPPAGRMAFRRAAAAALSAGATHVAPDLRTGRSPRIGNPTCRLPRDAGHAQDERQASTADRLQLGSDIYYYRRFDQHVRRIQEVMENADYLVAECERDLLLGRDYGFAGEPFAIVPCAGGFDLEQMRRLQLLLTV